MSLKNHIKAMIIINEPILGGATISAVEMIEGLKNCISLIVVIPDEGKVAEALRKLNVEFYIVPFEVDYIEKGKGSNSIANKNFINNYEAALKISIIVKEKGIHIIHTNSSVSNVGAIASLLSNIPHIWHIRELMEEHFDYEYINKDIKQKLFHCADQIVSISECVQKVFSYKYRIETIHLYNGLNIDKYKKNIGKNKAENLIHTFLLAGVISKEKGQFDAIRAIEELVLKGTKNIRLSIIGRGKSSYIWGLTRYILKHDLKDYISICSFREDLTEFRKQNEFILVCSQMEALGRVTLEAMLAGKVVIGANTGGTIELIGTKEERGLLYKQGNFHDLANSILRAIDLNEEQYKIKAEKAQRFVQENFFLSDYTDKIVKMYSNILEAYNKKLQSKDKTNLVLSLDKRYRELTEHINTETTIRSITDDLKYRAMFQIIDRWIFLKHMGIEIRDYFIQNKLFSIAIYGMGYLGCHLYDELCESEVEILFAIDRNKADLNDFLRIIPPQDKLPKVDVVVITVAAEERELKQSLIRKGVSKVVDFNDIFKFFQVYGV